MRSCCCCPASVTQPLAFAIMWMMTMLYKMMGPWGNYGVVIMALVFLMRLLMHPVTKKSQVTMMKVQKLGPKIQEVQKKYKGSPQEMHRRMAEVYQQAGMTQFADGRNASDVSADADGSLCGRRSIRALTCTELGFCRFGSPICRPLTPL